MPFFFCGYKTKEKLLKKQKNIKIFLKHLYYYQKKYKIIIMRKRELVINLI